MFNFVALGIAKHKAKTNSLGREIKEGQGICKKHCIGRTNL